MVTVNDWRGEPFGVSTRWLRQESRLTANIAQNCLIDYDNQSVQRNLPELFLSDCVCCPPRPTPLHVRFRYLHIRLQWLLLGLPTFAFFLALCAVMVSLETKMVEHLPGKAPRTPLRWLGDPILAYLVGMLGSERCLLLQKYWAACKQILDALLGHISALIRPARHHAKCLLGSSGGLLLQESWASCMQVVDACMNWEWYFGDRLLGYAGSLLDSPQGLRLREYRGYCTGGVDAWLHRAWTSVDR